MRTRVVDMQEPAEATQTLQQTLAVQRKQAQLVAAQAQELYKRTKYVTERSQRIQFSVTLVMISLALSTVRLTTDFFDWSDVRTYVIISGEIVVSVLLFLSMWLIKYKDKHHLDNIITGVYIIIPVLSVAFVFEDGEGVGPLSLFIFAEILYAYPAAFRMPYGHYAYSTALVASIVVVASVVSAVQNNNTFVGISNSIILLAFVIVTVLPSRLAHQATEEQIKVFSDLESESYIQLALLERVIPRAFLDQLMSNERIISTMDGVTVLFCEVMAMEQTPSGVVWSKLGANVDPSTLRTLSRVFQTLDEVVARNGVFKVETIGSEYMAVSGMPTNEQHPNCTAFAMLQTAMDMMDVVRERHGEQGISLQIGVNTGTTVEAILGRKLLPRWKLFGDTVNTASRMKSNGQVGRIHCTAATRNEVMLAAMGVLIKADQAAAKEWAIKNRVRLLPGATQQFLSEVEEEIDSPLHVVGDDDADVAAVVDGTPAGATSPSEAQGESRTGNPADRLCTGDLRFAELAGFYFSPRRKMRIKGKGMMRTFYVQAYSLNQGDAANGRVLEPQRDVDEALSPSSMPNQWQRVDHVLLDMSRKDEVARNCLIGAISATKELFAVMMSTSRAEVRATQEMMAMEDGVDSDLNAGSLHTVIAGSNNKMGSESSYSLPAVTRLGPISHSRNVSQSATTAAASQVGEQKEKEKKVGPIDKIRGMVSKWAHPRSSNTIGTTVEEIDGSGVPAAGGAVKKPSSTLSSVSSIFQTQRAGEKTALTANDGGARMQSGAPLLTPEEGGARSVAGAGILPSGPRQQLRTVRSVHSVHAHADDVRGGGSTALSVPEMPVSAGLGLDERSPGPSTRAVDSPVPGSLDMFGDGGSLDGSRTLSRTGSLLHHRQRDASAVRMYSAAAVSRGSWGRSGVPSSIMRDGGSMVKQAMSARDLRSASMNGPDITSPSNSLGQHDSPKRKDAPHDHLGHREVGAGGGGLPEVFPKRGKMASSWLQKQEERSTRQLVEGAAEQRSSSHDASAVTLGEGPPGSLLFQGGVGKSLRSRSSHGWRDGGDSPLGVGESGGGAITPEQQLALPSPRLYKWSLRYMEDTTVLEGEYSKFVREAALPLLPLGYAVLALSSVIMMLLQSYEPVLGIPHGVTTLLALTGLGVTVIARSKESSLFNHLRLNELKHGYEKDTFLRRLYKLATTPFGGTCLVVTAVVNHNIGSLIAVATGTKIAAVSGENDVPSVFPSVAYQLIVVLLMPTFFGAPFRIFVVWMIPAMALFTAVEFVVESDEHYWGILFAVVNTLFAISLVRVRERQRRQDFYLRFAAEEGRKSTQKMLHAMLPTSIADQLLQLPEKRRSHGSGLMSLRKSLSVAGRAMRKSVVAVARRLKGTKAQSVHPHFPQQVSRVPSIHNSSSGGSVVFNSPSMQPVALLQFDLVGFTTLSAEIGPHAVVGMLDRLYTLFDRIVERRGAYKVETIGDAFLVCCGAPEPRAPRESAVVIAKCALDMLRRVEVFPAPGGRKLKARIGIHIGRVLGGIIGSHMPRYQLFGPEVDRVSEMESGGEPGRLRASPEIIERLQGVPDLTIVERKPDRSGFVRRNRTMATLVQW